jgi:hypothetical protein
MTVADLINEMFDLDPEIEITEELADLILAVLEN